MSTEEDMTIGIEVVAPLDLTETEAIRRAKLNELQARHEAAAQHPIAEYLEVDEWFANELEAQARTLSATVDHAIRSLRVEVRQVVTKAGRLEDVVDTSNAEDLLHFAIGVSTAASKLVALSGRMLAAEIRLESVRERMGDLS